MKTTNKISVILLIIITVPYFAFAQRTKFDISVAEKCKILRKIEDGSWVRIDKSAYAFESDSIVFGRNSRLVLWNSEEKYGLRIDTIYGTRLLKDIVAYDTPELSDGLSWGDVFASIIGINRPKNAGVGAVDKQANESKFEASVRTQISNFIDTDFETYCSVDTVGINSVDAQYNRTDSLLFIKSNLPERLYVDVLYTLELDCMSIFSSDYNYISDIVIESKDSVVLSIDPKWVLDGKIYVVLSREKIMFNKLMRDYKVNIDSSANNSNLLFLHKVSIQ